MGNKIVNLIKLYDYVQDFGMIIVFEAANYLGVSSKTIYRYIKCLQQAGVILDFDKGSATYHKSDYKLDKINTFPDLTINKLNRLLRIYTKIYQSKERSFTLDWYTSNFGMSKRTLSRDLSILRRAYVDIFYDRLPDEGNCYRVY